MNSFSLISNSPIFIFAVVIFLFSILAIVFAVFAVFSPKLRGKLMSWQVKAAKNMLDESKDDLSDLYNTASNIAITGKKKVMDEHADVMEEISIKEAEIESRGIEIKARALKQGLTNESVIYCKHCGSTIDNDSKFCKICGKEQ